MRAAHKKKLHKKTSRKIIRSSSERAVASRKLLITFGIFLILVVIGCLGIFQPWKQFSLPFTSQKISIVKPKTDMGRARQMTVDPAKTSFMQITNREGVIITLEVPEGAIKEKTVVKMIPFYQDKNSSAPTAGVIISPASLDFTRPVTLSFNFSDTKLRNEGAPKNAISQEIRISGSSHVMQIDAKATTLTPTLIARTIETQTYLPARILTGGAYVFSLDGKAQTEIATKALDASKLNSLMTMESALTLLANDKKLSPTQLKQAKAAVAKILSKKTPPAAELYAALTLQKQIKETKLSFIPMAYAFETSEGYFQVVCKEDGLSVEEYLGFAKSAQLLGHDGIADSCISKAKNIIADEAKKVLSQPGVSLKSVIIALQNVQLVGAGDDSNLDEQLVEKAKEVATRDGKKVSDDPNSSAVDAAVELQRMEAVGATQGPTYDSLKKKVTDAVEAKEATMEELGKEAQKELEKREEEADSMVDAIEEEEILSSAAMSALGIGMLKAFGFDELDEASLKQKFSEMTENAKQLNEAAYVMCKELDGDDCDKNYSWANNELDKNEQEGYRVAEDIGHTQSQEYETPDYLEENGHIELYFEEEPTPTPEGNKAEVEESSSEEDTTQLEYGEMDSQDNSDRNNSSNDTEDTHMNSQEEDQ